MLKSLISLGISKTELSGIFLPPGSDYAVRTSLKPISGASDFRRSVNGDLHNVARDAFKKYAVSVSCDDKRPAAFSDLFPGQYIELVPHEPHHLSLHTSSTSAILPRAAVDVIGMTAAGDIIQPSAQQADPRPLQTEYDSARVATLRASQTVTFAESVVSVRYRPVLACLLLNWSQDSTEHKSSAGWSLELEEV
jgi:hypothetical protein